MTESATTTGPHDDHHDAGAADPVEALVGPHTGVTRDDITRRAEYSWDLARGTRPPWPDLDDATRAELERRKAADMLAEFHAPPPPDPRPIDHNHPSSPPHPTGADEHAYWVRRVRDAIAEARAWARSAGARVDGDLDDPSTLAVRSTRGLTDNPFFRGRVAETITLLEALHSGRAPADTGRAEVAHWITSQQARVDAIAPLPGDQRPFVRGHHDSARLWLSMFRGRQRTHADPGGWKRGGHALVAALNAADPAILTPAAGEAVPLPLVLIALHDERRDPPTGIGNPYGAAVDLVRRYTDASRGDCEYAVRRAVDDGLVHSHHPALLTETGDRAYRRLLGHLTT